MLDNKIRLTAEIQWREAQEEYDMEANEKKEVGLIWLAGAAVSNFFDHKATSSNPMQPHTPFSL